MQVVILLLLAQLVLCNSIKGLPFETLLISKSGQLVLQTFEGIGKHKHTDVTILCNGKKIKQESELECVGKFEVVIKTENKNEHSNLKVQCDGLASTLTMHSEEKSFCVGQFISELTEQTKAKEHMIDKYHQISKCSQVYTLQQFHKGDALMNETCEGGWEEIETTEQKNEASSQTIELDGEDIYDDNMDSTMCIAKCDGVRVQTNYPYPCRGIYELSCSNTTEVCDGKYQSSHGTSCIGSFESTTSGDVNTVTQRCANRYSSYKRRKNRGSTTSQVHNCRGSYSYVTIKTGTKSKDSQGLLIE